MLSQTGSYLSTPCLQLLWVPLPERPDYLSNSNTQCRMQWSFSFSHPWSSDRVWAAIISDHFLGTALFTSIRSLKKLPDCFAVMPFISRCDECRSSNSSWLKKGFMMYDETFTNEQLICLLHDGACIHQGGYKYRYLWTVFDSPEMTRCHLL